MPELPEVETIRRGLNTRIKGKRISNIVIENKKSFQGLPGEVNGKAIIDVARRAKLVIIQLEGKVNLLFHLKMTGQLIYIDKKIRFAGGHPSHDWHTELPNNYTRIIFEFYDGSKLFFNDLRKFGWCKVMTEEETKTYLSDYGPEPFSDAFTAEYLFNMAKRYPNRKIKQFIMDQTIIAGVGNIYNDESLYIAKILPITQVSALKLNDWKIIVDSIKKILELGIKYGGTTDSDYVNVDGKIGGMQNHLSVYRKTGEKCPCGGKIEKMKIGGRGTYYCPACQRELK